MYCNPVTIDLCAVTYYYVLPISISTENDIAKNTRQGYNNASWRHYLDIIVGDIEGDIGSNLGWGGGDWGVEEEETGRR